LKSARIQRLLWTGLGVGVLVQQELGALEQVEHVDALELLVERGGKIHG